MIRVRIAAIIFCATAVVALGAPPRKAPIHKKLVQDGSFTLTGQWTVTSKAINGATYSRMGNTLGFPVRNMVFAVDGDLRTGEVLREDEGPNVIPLGDWRVEGNYLSAAFELWCPDTSVACGSVVMRGNFSDSDTINGTMAVFFETPDPTTPTGLDTWIFSFHGVRQTTSGGGQ